MALQHGDGAARAIFRKAGVVTYIDERGRLFGKINLVDATVAAVLLVLIPLAYGTYLLFQPAVPRIDSVSPSAITKEEERISAGGRLVAKFKVRGEGFTPLLRARINNADALGFVFETPNSADVLVGPLPPGAHDLVLVDGLQEVARAAGVITIQPATAISIRAVGSLIRLDQELANAIRVGTALPEPSPAYRVVALGPLSPDHRRVALAKSVIDVALPDTRSRAAVIDLQCDALRADNPCTIEDGASPVVISLPGPQRFFNFAIEELLPATPAAKAIVRVRLVPGSPATVRRGDRDELLDERAAVVSGVTAGIVTLEAGVDQDNRGWQYRGQRLIPGASFVFSTDRYQADGVILSFELMSPP